MTQTASSERHPGTTLLLQCRYSYGLNGPSSTSGMATGSSTTQGMKYLTGNGPQLAGMQVRTAAACRQITVQC